MTNFVKGYGISGRLPATQLPRNAVPVTKPRLLFLLTDVSSRLTPALQSGVPYSRILKKHVSSMSENRNTSPDRVDLRDTFAAAALTGLLADDGDRTEQAMPNFTARAYEWADAMLLQRNGAADTRETVCPHVRGTVTQHCSLNFTVTDEEREAIEWAVETSDYYASAGHRQAKDAAATLRSLLARLAVE